MTHICVGKLTTIGSDNGLSPGRRQAIIWTNAGILLIGPLGTNFSEISIGIQIFSFKKMHLKMSSAKWRLFSLGLNEFKRKKYTYLWNIPVKPFSLWLVLLHVHRGGTEYGNCSYRTQCLHGDVYVYHGSRHCYNGPTEDAMIRRCTVKITMGSLSWKQYNWWYSVPCALQ